MESFYTRAFAPFKRLLPRPVWGLVRAFGTGIITPLRFSLRTGHWKSTLGRVAKDASGAPIPWYTYPAIDFLIHRNYAGRKVLEFGGGQSTLFWAARAASVFTVEEDADWHSTLKDQVPPNVSLHYVPVDHETRSIKEIKELLEDSAAEEFDIIVVDGHLRKELAALAFDYLASDGALILDNSEGYGFHDTIKTKSCKRIDFFGFSPGVSLQHCTSLVFTGDCFLLRPDIPIANIEPNAA